MTTPPGRRAGAGGPTAIRTVLAYWVPAFAYIGLIFTLSSIQGDELPTPFSIPYLDKVAHLLEYSLLGLLLGRAIHVTFRGWSRFAALSLTLLAGAVIGALDEIYQRRIPGRSSDVRDWIVDVAAVLLALLVAQWAGSRSLGRSEADSKQEGRS